MQDFLRQDGVQTPKIIYIVLITYELRLNMFKNRPEIKLAYLTKMQNFLR